MIKVSKCKEVVNYCGIVLRLHPGAQKHKFLSNVASLETYYPVRKLVRARTVKAMNILIF